MRLNTVKLITLMYEKGLKTGDVVKSSGLSKATVSGVRSGRTCTPDTAAKLANALNVPVTDLIAEE